MSELSIRFNPRYLSDIAWDQWIEALEEELPAAKEKLADAAARCEETRPSMAYNTGSVSFSTMLLLYCLVRNSKPSNIFEIGTFIGKTTTAMAIACDRNGKTSEIFTCDGNNDFHLPKIAKTPVHGFPRASSTSALKSLLERKISIELAVFDGRLVPEDIPLLEQLTTANTLFALDDFEGMEKGVANYMLMRSRQKFASHALIYPASTRTLAKLGLNSVSTVALLVPVSNIVFTNQ
jgi:predicted O-methyltransferase YrrM